MYRCWRAARLRVGVARAPPSRAAAAPATPGSSHCSPHGITGNKNKNINFYYERVYFERAMLAVSLKDRVWNETTRRTPCVDMRYEDTQPATGFWEWGGVINTFFFVEFLQNKLIKIQNMSYLFGRKPNKSVPYVSYTFFIKKVTTLET